MSDTVPAAIVTPATNAPDTAPADPVSVVNHKCPRCPGYCMLNSRTGKYFPTCFKCSTRCPTKNCNGFRGKSAKGHRYRNCSRCSFGDKYKKPERKSDKTPDSKNKSEDEISLNDEEVVINDDLQIERS